jgi:hypothetical protein
MHGIAAVCKTNKYVWNVKLSLYMKCAKLVEPTEVQRYALDVACMQIDGRYVLNVSLYMKCVKFVQWSTEVQRYVGDGRWYNEGEMMNGNQGVLSLYVVLSW